MKLEIIMCLFLNENIEVPEVGTIFKKDFSTYAVLRKDNKEILLSDIDINDKIKITQYFSNIDITRNILYKYIVGCDYEYKKHATIVRDFITKNIGVLPIFDKDLYIIILFKSIIEDIKAKQINIDLNQNIDINILFNEVSIDDINN